MGIQTDQRLSQIPTGALRHSQLRINYQIGYNPLITFSPFWRLSSQTSSKKKSARAGVLCNAELLCGDAVTFHRLVLH